MEAFIITARSDGLITVQCPRKDCGQAAVVHAKRWAEARPGIKTRSCTYCFRVSELPAKRGKKRKRSKSAKISSSSQSRRST